MCAYYIEKSVYNQDIAVNESSVMKKINVTPQQQLFLILRGLAAIAVSLTVGAKQ